MSAASADLIRLYEWASYDHKSVKAPIIGISMDAVDTRSNPGSFWYSEYPWYAIGKRYCDAVVQAGGIPVLLCYNLSNIAQYVRILDGLLIAGVAFDIDPVLYGEDFRHKTTVTRPSRTQFEWAMTQKMMDQNKPILGITGGMQLINVMLGGTLIQHILEEVPSAEIHTQNTLLVYPQHTVEIHEGTEFYKEICQFDSSYTDSIKNRHKNVLCIQTNSYHHQSIKKIGQNLRITAQTRDGIIEGIESTFFRFCKGVQWNAEFLMTPVDMALFKAFVNSSRDSLCCTP